jgi:serine/threonine protein kinase
VKKPTAFGKYFLLERINIGGMAEVFRAKAFGVEGFERLVAVKRILPSIAEDKEFIRMFIEEAKLAVQLNHANVAQIFDLGVVDGSYYIALEHVHGRDLRGIFERCRQIGEAMPVAQACFIAMKVCEGLDYAHNKRDQQGRELALVHRDVSPQNILVSFEGEVKLIDFGIAKAAGTGPKTQSGILKGKLSYMSPEQVRGLQVDRRSDVFSCGIVLYELLTGERLFVAESDYSTLEKVRNVEILPPSTYNRKIPDELERIVLKALTRDVEDRYPNAIDLHDELQAFVYTAGEFYSRKDLAGWMKKVFGKEIEEETAKLESYRQLKPPTPTLSSMPPPPASPAAPAASAPTSAAAAPTGPIASSAVSAPTAVPPSAPTTGPISAMSAMPTAQLPAAMQTPSLSAVTTSPGPIVLPPPTPTSLPIALPIPTPPSMPIAVPLPSDEPAPASRRLRRRCHRRRSCSTRPSTCAPATRARSASRPSRRSPPSRRRARHPRRRRCRRPRAKPACRRGTTMTSRPASTTRTRRSTSRSARTCRCSRRCPRRPASRCSTPAPRTTSRSRSCRSSRRASRRSCRPR